MITSPDMLRKETVALLSQINKQIDSATKQAKELGCEPEDMRDASGGWVMNPLLLAKVMAINTLVELNYNLQPRSRRGS